MAEASGPIIGSHVDSHVDSHGVEHPAEPHHPGWSTYWKVAVILTVITITEVWIYYTPFHEHRLFVPALLVMSALKFAIVVMFYMHLKYDSKVFRSLFLFPLAVAFATVLSLLFLFGHLHLGAH